MKIEIIALHENPLNAEIYGTDDPVQFEELVEKIKSSGYIKPIIITRNYEIISGHRRYRAAKLLGRNEIEVEVFNGEDDQVLTLLLNENAFREKTTLQKVREAEFYRKIEEKKAEERRKFIGLQNLGQMPVMTSLPELEKTGTTRSIVAKIVGMTERQYDKARKVTQRLDQEQDAATKWLFEETLNTSVDAATKLIDKSDDFLQKVIEKTEGDVKKVTPIIRELERTEVKPKIQMPDGYYQVIYVDFTVPIHDDYADRFIGALGEKDSVLLMWVLPKSLDEALGVIRKWGFKYQTCMVWNKDFCDAVSGNGEILLISVRGKPPMMSEAPVNSGKTEKPSKVRELIESTYSGSKLELLPDGWVVWGSCK